MEDEVEKCLGHACVGSSMPVGGVVDGDRVSDAVPEVLHHDCAAAFVEKKRPPVPENRDDPVAFRSEKDL